MSNPTLSVVPSAPETEPTDGPEIELEMDDAPSQGAKPKLSPLALVLAAIRAIIVGTTLASADAAFTALRAAITPALSWPEGPNKAAVRAAKDVKMTEINAVSRAARAAAEVSTAPVEAPSAPVAPIEAPIEAPVEAPATQRTWHGTWTCFRRMTGKPWGGRLVTDARNQNATPRAGDRAVLTRRNGSHSIVTITGVESERVDRGEHCVFVLIERGAQNAPAEDADALVPSAEQIAAAATAVVEAMAPAADVDAIEAASEAQDTSVEALASELGAIGAEASANAATQALGSLRGGQLRIVGFSSAQGYVDALAHGVKQATADSYKATLRTSYGYTADQITALAVTIIPEAELPVGAGVRHTFESPGIFDRPKAERTFQVGGEKVTSGAQLLRAGDLIAGALVGGAGGAFSWEGAGKVKRAALIEALATVGREDTAPAAKSAHAQAGRAVDAVRSLGYHVHTIKGAERRMLPPHVAHRWIVGRAIVNSGDVGSAYGTRILTVDLDQDDQLHFVGDAYLAARIRADFEARTADDVYVSADITPWLHGVLRNAHGATRFGVNWYVPHGQREAAEQLTRAVAAIWGTSWCHGMPVSSGRHLIEGMSAGMHDDIAKHERAASDMRTEADQKRDNGAKPHQVNEFLATHAAKILAKLTDTSARVNAYAPLLGEEALAPLKLRIDTLATVLRPLTDGGFQRGALLEFT